MQGRQSLCKQVFRDMEVCGVIQGPRFLPSCASVLLQGLKSLPLGGLEKE